jgi:phosphatidylglycerophosphatase C
MKRKIAVFDFDGTITTRDSLIEFIKFTNGTVSLALGLFLFSPLLILYKLKLYPNWKVKQRLFNYFYGGMEYAHFKELGNQFAQVIEKFIRPKALKQINNILDANDSLYIISASIDEYVRPWCELHNVNHVICTQIEVRDNKLTGRFMTENCYGEEKVNRLLKEEPLRNEYYLVAYGDNQGDKELIELADEGYYNKFV